jgi:fucose permease
MKAKTIPIFLMFFIMGFGDAVGTMVGFATKEFELSRGMAGLLPFVGFIAYAFFPVPASVLQDKKGKKFVLLLGLTLILAGYLIPIMSISKYIYLLVSILMVGTGIAVAQVAGNPILRDVSAKGKFSRNLAFAQFIKAIGSNSGPYVIPLVITLGLFWQSIFYIYFLVAVITMLLILPLKIKEREDEEKQKPASIKSSLALLKNPFVFLMVFSLFLYVGAEVGMGSWIASYLEKYYQYDLSSMATLGIGFFYLSLMVGRLLGSVILNWVSAKKFFVITSIISVVAILGLFSGTRAVSIVSIFIIGLGFANIFPLIFSITIDSMPEKSNELSGLMVTSIVGGAIMPLLMGLVADYSIMASFGIPLASFVFITIVSIVTTRVKKA